MRRESKIDAVLKESNFSNSVISVVEQKPIKKRLKRIEMISGLLGG